MRATAELLFVVFVFFSELQLRHGVFPNETVFRLSKQSQFLVSRRVLQMTKGEHGFS